MIDQFVKDRKTPIVSTTRKILAKGKMLISCIENMM